MEGTRAGGFAGGLGSRIRRPVRLRVYVVALVVLFVAAAGANAVYQHQAAAGDARAAALADAGFGARGAAHEIAADVSLARLTVAATAANPALVQALAAPARCTLSFSGADVFTSGHLDLVRRNGTVVCSSLAPRKLPGYAGAAWLAAALKGPVLAGPLADARTGKQVVLVAAPVAGKGVLAALLDLGALGPGLASALGGPRHLEFVVTSTGRPVVLARSASPGRWMGRPVAGTPFAGAAGGAEHRGLDGVSRLYGEAAVPGLGWRVFAGAATSAALAAATRLSSRQLLITLAGLLLLLAAAMVVHQRIARPVAKLSAGVRAATEHLTADPVTVGGPAEVAALAADFSRLIAAASREREATSQVAAIVESSADAIIGKSLDGVITSWNAGAQRLYGYAPSEIIGRNVSVLIPPDRAGELAPLLARLRRGEHIEPYETQRLRKDGTTADVSVAISPIRDASGAVTGAATVARDVTERNRLEAARRDLEDRLHQSERLESLGQLAGGIAHDFNNLLGAITSYATFVTEQTADRPAVRADAEQIQDAAQRAARLTRQLLIFARRETAQLEILDLNAIVTDMHSLLSRSIGPHIELRAELAAGIPAIQADHSQIEQVLLNLAINARDAMPGGGTLTIGTSPAELGDSDTGQHPGISPGPYAQLTISDTGTGMSTDVAAHIFEPFFTTKPQGQGTGLGLSTVYGILTDAGGGISVESEPGAGTTFRLYFPATSAAVPVITPGRAPAIRGNGQTILVVDDELPILEATARILAGNGYTTLKAADHQQALALAASHDIQLLLTDSVMPHMSGRTLAEHITGLRPGLPVLYMSGYSQEMPGPHGLPRDGEPRLQKPFTGQTLLEKVHATLNPAPPQPPRRQP